ncbi:MAG: hypothetical protein ACLQOO_19330 [Terriglobia bacterium]
MTTCFPSTTLAAGCGKYAKRYAQGTNVVVLDPDVAQVFPTRSR